MVDGPYTPGMLTRLWRKRLPAIKRSAESEGVSVGLHEDAPAPVKSRAVVHEFGSSRVPARPFISMSTGDKPRVYAPGLRKMAHNANLEGIGKGGSVHAMAAVLASTGSSTIKEVIDSSVEPALASSTLAQKARKNQPRTALIATGQMRSNSVGRTFKRTGDLE